jgi:lipopolysaccharide transport system permease protein
VSDRFHAAREFDVWIEGGRADRRYWQELWHRRELLVILAWRNVAIRYKQTVAGIAWAILQPLLSIIIMTIVFGKIAGLPSEGDAPYALMILAGLLPWQYFANGLAGGSQSIVSNASLVSKVYFPRTLIPCSALLAALVDFLVSCAILAALLLWFRYVPHWQIVTLPVFVLLATVVALGPSLIFTALAVRYRDVAFVIPFVVQLGLYVSPVAYSSSIVRDKFGETALLLYALNPMVAVVDGFRWAILGVPGVYSGPAFMVSLASGGIIFVAGIAYFRAAERSFADFI